MSGHSTVILSAAKNLCPGFYAALKMTPPTATAYSKRLSTITYQARVFSRGPTAVPDATPES